MKNFQALSGGPKAPKGSDWPGRLRVRCGWMCVRIFSPCNTPQGEPLLEVEKPSGLALSTALYVGSSSESEGQTLEMFPQGCMYGVNSAVDGVIVSSSDREGPIKHHDAKDHEEDMP